VKRLLVFAALSVLLGVAAGAGYWLGMSKRPAPAAAQLPTVQPKPKILYYRNPMGLADTSPVPKKDSMGMDYIPVYEGDEPAGPALKISLDRVQKLGVKTEPAAVREISRVVRAVGTVQVNERLQRTVSPKFEGWIQRLLVATTGESVRRGQPLMEVYSPDLITAQQDYLIAWKGVQSLKDASPDIQASMKSLVDNSLQRLRNWDISDEELARLQQEGKVNNAITLRSPVDGIVLEKPAVQGMRFMPGEKLYRIADLSSLWLLAEVFEQDLAWIRPGQDASIKVNAYPDKLFAGKVAFVYPTITAETRTAKVRIELQNPGRVLKPDMYASVTLAARQRGERRLTVSDSAVIDSGTRQIVLVRRGEGLFEPREVKLGQRGEGYVEVLEGLKEGENVVVSANFLIDAESNLKAAVSGFGHSAHDGGTPKQDATTAGGNAGGIAKSADAAAKAHAAEGKVVSAYPKTGSVLITHGPVASLEWGGMTMEFKVADPALFAAMKAGARIRFEFVERPPGEWTVVRATPLADGREAGDSSVSHDSHRGR
jgi:Cu(I)/Ag(I) efflux system membrane fusion protein